MLALLQSSPRPYPSNPQHVATALKVARDPGRRPATPDSFKPLPTEKWTFQNGYAVNGTSISLYAVPDPASKQVGQINNKAVGRIYLRGESWDLVQAGDQIGWARRAPITASKG